MFDKRILGLCLVMIFVAGGAPLFAISEDDTRLVDAAMEGNGDKVRMLLQQKVSVNTPQGDGTTALHWAAYKDDLELARLLLKAGAHVDAKTRLGSITPLFMAAKNGSAAMIELLLKAGASPNTEDGNGTTPLMLAAASGNTDAVKLLLDQGANINAKDKTNGQSPVIFAAALGRTSVIEMLARRGADLNANTNVAEIIRAEKKYKGTDKSVLFSSEGNNPPSMGGLTALHFAAREGYLDAVRKLVEEGANVNKVSASDKMSVASLAIINARFDIGKYLIEHGADPNLSSTDGVTPLYATIDARWAERTWYPAPSVADEKTTHLELMRLILDKGADPNARLVRKLWFRTYHGDWIEPSGATAFWLAAKANDIPAMKMLIAARADPGIRTNRGASALMAAAGFGLEPQVTSFAPDARLAAVKYLIEELGADVNAKDNQGYTPLHGAALTENVPVMRYLIAAGGDVKARADSVFGGVGVPDRAVTGKTGDTVADMANGPKAHNLQYPKTVALLESLGSENSDYCRASTCVVRTLLEDPKLPKKPQQ